MGVPLTADTTGWAGGTSLAYQWLVDGTPVAGATNASYTPDVSAVGLPVSLKVTGTLAGFNPVTRTSAAVVAVLGTLTAATPTISGTPQPGTQLSVVPGSWTPGTVFTYQWSANGTAIAGATSAIFIPTLQSQLGQTITVTVTGTKAGYATAQATSAATTPVAEGGSPQVSTPTPTISGTAKLGSPAFQSTLGGSWDDGVVLTYQWNADGNPIANANGTTFTLTAAQVGTVITLSVIGAKGNVVTKTSAPSATVLPGTQTLTPTPTITGTPKVGVALTAVKGTWDNQTTQTFQWTVGGIDVPGATTSTYTPVAADFGKTVTVKVISIRAGYTTVTKESAATVVVAIGTQTLTPTPAISGTPQVGVQLSAEAGTWDVGVGLSYQWLAGGVNVPSATAATFTPTAAEADKKMSVSVTGHKDGYTDVTKTSAETAVVALGTLTVTGDPDIGGSDHKVGVQLTAVTGTWDDGVTFTYQWTADTFDIPGATGSTYTPVVTDVGKSIGLKVTGHKDGYADITKTSMHSTSAIDPGDQGGTPTPTITGTPKVAVQLTANPGTWDDGVVLTYQWTVDSANVSGATDPTYTPVAGDLGKVVTVKVTGTKEGFTPVTKESNPTLGVLAGDLTNTPTPTVGGTAKVAQLLTATAGTWDAGVALSYQWTAGGTNIAGATAGSYTVVAGDVGKVITVKVTGTKTGYATVIKESLPTAVVAKADLTTTPTPTITGTARFGETLIALPGNWDAGVTLAYRWLADGVAVDGAIGSGYLLEAADVGKSFVVVVTGSKAGFNSVTKASAGTSAVSALSLVDSDCTVTLGGRAKVGRTLKSSVSECPANATLHYAWYAGGKQISGAHGATYQLKRKHAGKRIKVLVSITVPGYVSVLRASDPTTKVKK